MKGTESPIHLDLSNVLERYRIKGINNLLKEVVDLDYNFVYRVILRDIERKQ